MLQTARSYLYSSG